MFETPIEIAGQLGARIRTRRLALGWSQLDAAARAGIAYRTWRRLEADGKASIIDLVKAAVALRCEEDLKSLFPAPAAATIDELLERQRRTTPRSPARSRRR
jgi:transcriptional regulator with XRE-family HTH domain